MNPELKVFVENKVLEVIDGVKTMRECDRASIVVDSFEEMGGDRKTVIGFRDYLCDKTFEVHKNKYGKNHLKTIVDTKLGEINLV